MNNTIFIAGRKNEKVYFELEESNNIFSGTLIDARINIFEPYQSEYFILHSENLLPTNSYIEIDGVNTKDNIRDIKELTNLKLETTIKFENFCEKPNLENLNNDCLFIHPLSLSNLKFFKLRNFSDKYINFVNKNINNIKNLNQRDKTSFSTGFQINLDFFLKRDQFVYSIFENRIQKVQIKNAFFYLSEIENDKLKYNPDYTYELISENKITFKTKLIFKGKADIIRYISKLPKLN